MQQLELLVCVEFSGPGCDLHNPCNVKLVGRLQRMSECSRLLTRCCLYMCPLKTL